MPILSFDEVMGTPDSEQPRGSKKRTPDDVQADFDRLLSPFSGIQETSRNRTPEHNRKVGGKPNSQHLRGTARDIVVPPEHKQGVLEAVRAAGYMAIDEDDHIHLQMPRSDRAALGPPGSPHSESVMAKAAELDKFINSLSDDTDPDTGSKVMSFDEVMNSGKNLTIPSSHAPEPKNFTGWALEASGKTFEDDPVTGPWDRFKNKLFTALGQIDENDPRYDPTDFTLSLHPYGRGRGGIQLFHQDDPNAHERDLAERAKEQANAPDKTYGFVDTVRNPIDLIYNDSLPANAMEAIQKAPRHQREALLKARHIQQQEYIVAHPSEFPDVAVQSAQAQIDDRNKRRDPGVTAIWGELRKAAEEDPGQFGGHLFNMLMADPEMVFVPEMGGAKLLQTLNTGRKLGRVAVVADRILGAGGTGAALNMGMDYAAQASEGDEVTANELVASGGLGFAVGGLTGIFHRGAKAREQLTKGNVDNSTLDSILNDVAQEAVTTERIIETPESLPTNARERIERMLGIKDLTKEQKKEWYKARKAELTETFRAIGKREDYKRAKAAAHISVADQLAEAAKSRQARSAEAAASEARATAEAAEAPAERLSRLQREHEEAVHARETEPLTNMEALDKTLDETTARLDQEELIQAAQRGTEEVKAAMLRVVMRDAKLAKPKYQKGEIDPALVARLGIGSVFAGAAYYSAPEEQKLRAAGLGALLGLIIPGGGRVRDRLRQSGVISSEGDPIGLVVRNMMVKEGRAAGEILERERVTIEKAKAGNQAAFKELFDDNFPRIKRLVARYLREAGPRLGLDAEDVAMTVFTKAFQNLDKFKGDSQFYTWLHSIAENRALNAIKAAKTSKHGGKFKFTNTYAEEGGSEALGDVAGSRNLAEVAEMEAAEHPNAMASEVQNTPEMRMEAEQQKQKYIAILNSLPEKQRQVFLLNRVEQMTFAEIAKELNMDAGTVGVYVQRAQKAIHERLEKDFGAKPEIKVPRKQAGEIDPRLLGALGLATAGAAAGAYLNDQNKAYGATIGAIAAAGMLAKGPKGEMLGSTLLKHADYTLGVTSTRIMNISKQLWRRAIEHERVVLRDTHKHLKAVDPFLVKMQKLPKETYDVLTRAILTGNPEVTNRLLAAIGDKDLIEGWKQVRSTLDSLGDQLVALQRFKRKELDYFPRIVKDVDGLLGALGKERRSYLEDAISKADAESIKERGTHLTDLEKSLIINKVLKEEPWKSQQPGYAKGRLIEEITPELQQYYASPVESLHSYIKSAVEDIERAKFFGQDLKVNAKGSKLYTNTNASIGTLVTRLENEGKLTYKQAEEVAGLLRSRFLNGEKTPWWVIQGTKNLAYAGLLGNPLSAITQFGDAVLQAYTQDIRSALAATVRAATGRKIVKMEDFGLVDHMAEEFVSTGWTQRRLNDIFKISLFKGIDTLGKDIALNAAVLRMGKLAKTDKGIAEIARRYKDALGPEEFNQLIKDLHKGEPTDLVNSIAFAELSRTQPITRLELPQAYLDNPNGRLLYMFKTFMLKQADLLRRDGLNEMRSGRVGQGMLNIAHLGVVLGASGMATSVFKQWLINATTGRKQEIDLSASDIAWNAAKTFAISEYFLDQAMGVSKEEAAQRRDEGDEHARAQGAHPFKAAGGVILPPWKMFEEIVTEETDRDGVAKAWRYVPLIGRYLYESKKAEAEKRK